MIPVSRWLHSAFSPFTDVYYLRAEAFRLQHKLCRAFSDYASALQRNPRFVAVYLARGKALLHSRQLRPALNDFNSVVALDPTCAEAFACRARCRVQGAIDDWSKAIELQSTNADFFLGRAEAFAKVGGRRRLPEGDLPRPVPRQPGASAALALRPFVPALPTVRATPHCVVSDRTWPSAAAAAVSEEAEVHCCYCS